MDHNEMSSKELLNRMYGKRDGYTEYTIRHYHDVVGKSAEDFPFEDYADFIIDSTNPSLAVSTMFNLGWWFDSSEYEIVYALGHSPYLIFRVYRN